MDKKQHRLMTPFDNLISSNQLQMIKLLLPYTPPSNQRFLAIFVKYLELKNTLDYFKKFETDLHMQELSSTPPSMLEILEEIHPYMEEAQSEMVSSILDMMNMMEMAKDMQNMTSEVADGDPSHNNSEGFDVMSLLSGMFPPEQQAMFDTIANANANDFTMKGDGYDGQLDEPPGYEEY